MMEGRMLSGVILLVFVAGIYAENESGSLADSIEICRYCVCKNSSVDCTKNNYTTFFTLAQWEQLKDFKPTHVDLSGNNFTNVTAIASLPIEVLNLSNSHVVNITKAAFKDLKQLRVLDLSHNLLTSQNLVPCVFEGTYSPEGYEPLPSMRVLDLSHNDLHTLNQDLFEHLPELTELDLSGNPLAVMDHFTTVAIASLSQLKVLRMRSCQIVDVPDKMLHTPRFLERLDLSDNLLPAVPQEIKETTNLLYLNLNGNPIKELDMSSEENPGFPRLEKLQELHMCNMRSLRRIGPGAMAGLESLRVLHMSMNPVLTEIDPKALARPDDVGETNDYPPISELYLRSNNLASIDGLLLVRWDNLQKMDVSDNPFLCDCTTQWMVDTLVPIVDARKGNSSTMICKEPEEMHGYTMKHLHDIHRTMRCLDKYGNHPEKDGAILMGALIGVLLSVPIVLSLMLLWRRGYFSCLGLRGPIESPRTFYKRAPADDSFVYNN